MIDIQTFVLALGAGNLAFALLVACYMQGANSSLALRHWVWARLVSGLGQCGWWAAPHAGLHLGETLAMCVWDAGMLLDVAAYCHYFNVRHLRRMMLACGALCAVTVAWALATGASRAQLICAVAVLVSVFVSGSAFALLRPGCGRTLLQRIIGVTDALYALVIWVWVIAEKGNVETTSISPLLGLAYLASYVLMIVNGVGFLLMCKQKDDARMQQLATVDSLTDTLNRRAFFERAESARQLALRLHTPIALLMLDLDHFKQINDTYGHACGDQVLRLFADTARGVLRDQDLMGRLGGEEFALALPGTSLEGACQAAERLRAAVDGATLPSCASGGRMSVSVGVVMIEPNEELTAAFARADHALYAAKTGGRNRVEVGASILKRA